MRLLQELPEVEAKIQSGDLNLTQIAMARTHFREVKATSAQKQELLQSIENQSTRTTERLLAENKPTDTLIKPEVIEKPLRGQRLEVTLVLDKSLQDVLSEIQILLGKPYSKLELLNMLATEKLQAMKKDSKSQERNAQPAPDEMNRTRYIPTTNIREVKVRDGHQCQFVDSLTGRKCSARFHLQVDHVKPFAKGGDSSLKNLRILCVNHNKLHAIRQFGLAKMKTYLPQLN